MGDIYYREQDAQGWDGNARITLIEYRVVSRTPKGVWIVPTWDWNEQHKRFVLDGEGKRFAYPTKEQARQNYIRRKRSEIAHTARQHDKAKYLLYLAENDAPPPEAEPVVPMLPGVM